MNITTPANWQTFKEQLQKHPELDLQFQYSGTQWVNPSYHITEIKQAVINSVDCGGVTNSWLEIVIQLWEPSGKQQQRAMKVKKALSIIELVESKLHLNSTAIVKIEFGNSQFDTRQMYPGEMIVDAENLVIDLQPDFTQCKAINRGGSCGTDNKEEACCTPVPVKSTPAINPEVTSACCEPNKGCC